MGSSLPASEPDAVRARLGPIGIWSTQIRHGDPDEALAATVELDELGFGTLWIPDVGGPVLQAIDRLLTATTAITVATGILNIWMHEPDEVAREHARIDELHPERFVLGLGVSHAPLVDAGAPGRYARPLEMMKAYLDRLDAHRVEGHRPRRLLAALAPKMLELARERALGIHPYLVPVEHTRWARERLGAGPVLALSLTVVLEPDAEKARAIARNDLATYLGLPNYVTTWRRLGYGDSDFAGNGSDALVDALYAHGGVDEVAERIAGHRDAGADHLCLRVVTAHPDDHLRPPRAEWRRLAGLLG